MRLARLYVRMLRYRVATMIWLFMLLGAAFRDGLTGFSTDYVFATLSLASSYVAATSLNDVADEEIDRVNHPRDDGRPLVTGDARAADLLRLHWIAAGLALAAAAPLGVPGLVLASVSLAVSHAYSAGPLRLSYRTYLAPVALAVAYVLIPYRLGLAAAGEDFRAADLAFAGGLFALFVARIVLKDFRDRDGDARFGKPTLLLRFGKTATCLVSAAALLVGNALVLAAIDAPLALLVADALFVIAIGAMLHTLWRARDLRLEQIAIGIGARMGNGLLIALLGWLVLTARDAPAEVRWLFVISLTALFGTSYAALAARPHDIAIGYKG